VLLVVEGEIDDGNAMRTKRLDRLRIDQLPREVGEEEIRPLFTAPAADEIDEGPVHPGLDRVSPVLAAMVELLEPVVEPDRPEALERRLQGIRLPVVVVPDGERPDRPLRFRPDRGKAPPQGIPDCRLVGHGHAPAPEGRLVVGPLRLEPAAVPPGQEAFPGVPQGAAHACLSFQSV